MPVVGCSRGGTDTPRKGVVDGTGPATTVGLGYRAFGACGGGGGLASRRALFSAAIWGTEKGGVHVQWRL